VSGALEGIRVLAFTQGLAGPWAGLLLAAHGAEVVKVESAAAPDTFRRFGARNAPPRFLEYNRNTLSITVNLKHPRGPELIKKLVQKFDVVIDNFSAPVLTKYGLDYADLREMKQDIVMLRMPGFGTFGPKRDWQSWGQTLNAFSGALHLWRQPDAPVPAGSQTPLVDYMGGVIGLCAVMAALLDREQTGKGHFIDLSQAEAMGYFTGVTYLQALFDGADPTPAGNFSPVAAPHDCFPCRGEDRWCVITVDTEAQWQLLCHAMNREELARDPRFSSLASRLKYIADLNALVAEWTSGREAEDVMSLLQAAGVPCGVVQNGADLMHDPHLQARRFPVVLQHPVAGRLVFPDVPFRLSQDPGSADRMAPELGEHNDYVFGKILGLSAGEIAQLKAEQVLS
jgi:crotonobetainyl-CoA:carnitine CoA-transferase CaiB-like acyl-CoA transferase